MQCRFILIKDESRSETVTSNCFDFNLRLPDTLLSMSRKVVTVRNICNAWPYIFWWTVRPLTIAVSCDLEESSRKIWTTMKDYDTRRSLGEKRVIREPTCRLSGMQTDCFELREIWSLEIYRGCRLVNSSTTNLCTLFVYVIWIFGFMEINCWFLILLKRIINRQILF